MAYLIPTAPAWNGTISCDFNVTLCHWHNLDLDGQTETQWSIIEGSGALNGFASASPSDGNGSVARLISANIDSQLLEVTGGVATIQVQ